MGGSDLPVPEHPRIARGPLKIALADDALPDPDALAAEISEADARERCVAIHCVTRAELVVALAALAASGPRAGDRIEHAAVAPPELVEALAALRVTVVAQPVFVHERGDAYRAEVEACDLPWLHRLRAFLDAGVPLGAGSDAPFGEPDPWAAMRAAVERRTGSGEPLGTDEALSPEQALALFTGTPDSPGGLPRRIAPGAVADLCLLDRPWREARRALSADCVTATFCGGEIAFAR
jgi:predicted amidohydrolase YtcJ